MSALQLSPDIQNFAVFLSECGNACEVFAFVLACVCLLFCLHVVCVIVLPVVSAFLLDWLVALALELLLSCGLSVRPRFGFFGVSLVPYFFASLLRKDKRFIFHVTCGTSSAAPASGGYHACPVVCEEQETWLVT